MTESSCLYTGSVTHHRLRPHVHRLRYRVFWMMIDIDEIDHLSSRMKFFSHNRFNLVSFYDSDHGGTSEATLRSQIERLLERSGLDANGQKITLFCMPRILGYGFNPLSVFFCYRQDGEPSAIVYEVHNTFGERHSYVMACESNDKTPITRCCDKEFYVSPFLGMDMFYSFRMRTPGCHINIAISGQDKDGPLITASLSGLRTGLSDRTLLKAVLTHPLLTLKVMAAIHWHALRMVLKGFRLHPRSPGKSHSVTIIPNNGSSR
ncbi:MAG: DUF1365 domain-containing protein [Bradyrhizobiaceae bacterium]|nr:MAG: DUF1365 domain-containing protein [Bradyrhizobiaceae bacterium]